MPEQYYNLGVIAEKEYDTKELFILQSGSTNKLAHASYLPLNQRRSERRWGREGRGNQGVLYCTANDEDKKINICSPLW